MDPVTVIRENWTTIAAAPLAAFLLLAVGFALGFGLSRLICSNTIEAARERSAGAIEEVGRLRGEKGDLLKRLEGHGDDIAQIRSELAALPRIHASTRPPTPDDPGKDGDLWITYRDDEPPQRKPNG